ncbi:MAG: alpha/beta hydrolase [Microthrixaceae bacterium]
MPDDPQTSPDSPEFAYDEMAYFEENCAEYAIALPEDLRVERRTERVEVTGSATGRPWRIELSGLWWGEGPPELVFLHGGAQNAHTWDTVQLALDRPAIAFDLPGHGHSGRRPDADYGPRANAEVLVAALERVIGTSSSSNPNRVGRPVTLVGMSLGGLTANAVAAIAPELVHSLVIVDITPGVNAEKARVVTDFIAGPQYFPTFEEILARTVEYNPTRSIASLRRGILHNAHKVLDGGHAGQWAWNYDRRPLLTETEPGLAIGLSPLWDDVGAVTAPYTLVRGALSPVVDDDDVAELRRRQPRADVIVVPDAGHSVQGDRPLELAGIIAERLR